MRNAVTRSGHGAHRQLPRDITHPDQKVRLAQELNQMSVSGLKENRQKCAIPNL